MGATGGGVWKTHDFGASWRNVSDGFFNTPSIGAICVDQDHPETVYVGTGTDGLRSNLITGKGIYKSTDGGRTWIFSGLEKTGQIGAVELDPENPQTVFVAAIGQAFQPNSERGIFRSTDGGSTWEHVLFHSDTVGAVDLEIAPQHPHIIYAALWRAERKPWTIISGASEGGIYKSTDGGDHWSKLTEGLPDGLIGKIDLAVSADDPKRVYALIEASDDKGGLYRSDNFGASFRLVSNRPDLVNRPFYYCNVEANPQNANTVFVLANRYMRSYDAGESWERISSPHGDNHDLWIHPRDTMILIQCNDGGANVSADYGRTWSTQSNQPTAELYQVEVDDQYPYWLYAGQQDNSTITVPSLPPYPAPGGPSSYWLSVGGCETGPAVPKPGNPDIVYSNCKGRFGVYDKRTGQERQYYVGATNIYSHHPSDLEFRFQRVAPIHVSPHNPDVVYHASQFLHKTANDGQTWEIISPDLTANEPDKQVISGTPITRDITGEEYYSTIYSVRESPLKAGLIWVGANDGPVHLTLDGGKSWKNVTPSELPPGGRVDCIEPSPHDEAKAYIAVLRYQLGDWHPYIYRTTDYGASWSLLTDGQNGIPDDHPTRVIREDPVSEDLLFAGTEFGMFFSPDGGARWYPFQQNLPVTPVTDIRIHRGDLVLSTMGRSFWILDDITPLRQLDRLNADDAMVLFQPAPAIRHRFRSYGSSGVPEYPSAGVHFDFFLNRSTDEPSILEIRAENGKLIRTYTSDEADVTDALEEEPDMATGFMPSPPSPGLPSGPGFHRFTWNMRHAGAWDQNERSRYRSGPMVAPGIYQVHLKSGDIVQSADFEIHIDPNVNATGITKDDLLAQEELALQVMALLEEARRLEYAVSSELEALDQGSSNSMTNHRRPLLIEIQAALVTAEGPYMTPMLLDQIGYLNGMITRADQRPGQDAYKRYQALHESLQKLNQMFNGITGS
jgi:photosystem II stability/assembly factor-like uncharacterized protein